MRPDRHYPFSYPEPFLRAARRGTLVKSITGYHENMVRKQYPRDASSDMDLARAPRRTACKKGSGYENGHYPTQYNYLDLCSSLGTRLVIRTLACKAKLKIQQQTNKFDWSYLIRVAYPLMYIRWNFNSDKYHRIYVVLHADLTYFQLDIFNTFPGFLASFPNFFL